MGVDNKESNFELEKNGMQSSNSNERDESLDQDFQNFLKTSQGKEILSCFDESMKNTGNLIRREIGNFPSIKCKKS